MKKFIAVLCTLGIYACGPDNHNGSEIIRKAVHYAGGDKLKGTNIEFKFRNKEYGAQHREDGKFEYVRLFKDSIGLVRDVLTNTDFYREVNGKKIELADTTANKYRNSVNSVIYFALLPIGLDQPSVLKEYLEEKEIKGKVYYKIKVTFKEAGGGRDFEDVFIYWVNKQGHKVDYLAYKYEADGGGIRFREAHNERIVEGMRFVDYINYKPLSDIELENIDDAYLSGNLEEVSKIELKEVVVNPLPKTH